MAGNFDLGDYNTVAERIAEFRAAYPEGSLAPADLTRPYSVESIDGQSFVVFTAAAFRHCADTCPGIGTAWEPVPGPTQFTKNSELQNAETAAWGRAIIAVGAADAKKGVASREDVQSRQAEDEHRAVREMAAPGLRTSIDQAIEKLTDDEKAALKDWFKEQNLPAVKRMDAAQCDAVLDHLMQAPF